jgi:hypothetical protein
MISSKQEEQQDSRKGRTMTRSSINWSTEPKVEDEQQCQEQETEDDDNKKK